MVERREEEGIGKRLGVWVEFKHSFFKQLMALRRSKEEEISQILKPQHSENRKKQAKNQSNCNIKFFSLNIVC